MSPSTPTPRKRRQRASETHRTGWVRERHKADGNVTLRGRCSCGWQAEVARVAARDAAEDCIRHLEAEGLIDV